jgi:hypothetical protein
VSAQRKYTLIRADAAASTAITYVQVAVPATTAIDVTRAFAAQRTSTTSAMQQWSLIGSTTAGTVTGQSPAKLEGSGPASLCVSGATGSGITATIEPAGTLTTFYDDSPNVLNGWLYLPVPEERATVAPSTQVGIKAPQAPGAQTWRIGLNFIELV